MAGLWKLPCVFVCQDNNYGISVNKANSTAVASIADRASSYGMPGARITENDPDLIFAAVGEAVARARGGEGPTLLEVKVDRLYGHFQGDPETYRPKGEVESLRRKDSLAAYEARLKSDGVVTDVTIAEIRGRARRSGGTRLQRHQPISFQNFGARRRLVHLQLFGWHWRRVVPQNRGLRWHRCRSGWLYQRAHARRTRPSHDLDLSGGRISEGFGGHEICRLGRQGRTRDNHGLTSFISTR